MWYVCDVLYAVLYICVCCFVVCGCDVSRRYVDVCYCDMFSVVYVYFDHLKFCVVCVYGRRCVCCGECYVVSNECDEPTSCLVQHIVAHCCEVMYFWCFDFWGELGFLNCDDVCMCVVNKQFELLEFVSESVYVDLQYDEISLTFTAGSVCLCGVCPWSVCVFVVVPYVVGAVVAVTAMHVLLFVLHVCEGDGSAGVGFGGGVVVEISVVRGVGGVYDMCMCLARSGVGCIGG